ncbi:MAG: lipase, partial [Clostridia bacterium]|nr:lipase [Clostridia bacterium]
MASKQHPYVFVHGMMGWGEDKKFYKVIPYWGMVTGNYPRRMREKGYEVYTPTVSPLGSAWDRACELYANLTGTTVDYGVAHSKEKGHNRFGETFPEAMLPDWTPERSIHLLGHSFGGPTMRMFVELLRNGSPEERAATPAGQLSPLFEGGHGDLVKSITTISGPFDGITFPHALPKTVDYGLTYGIPMVASIIGNVGSGRVYDFQMSQWGITAVKNGVRFARDMLNMKAIRNFVKAKD